ncbi:MAG: glycosyltransferase family 1 protein [Bacteroidetes bacterium]|nr:glycosyltransferase family 1 protein [Bacteroidota bacterium]
MRIAVNTRLLIKDRLEGIGWFTFETLKRICIQHPEHEFIFFFDRPYSNEFVFAPNVTAVVLNPPARHPVLWYIYFEWSVYRALKKYRADLFLSTDGWLSLRSKVKTINVIHDLNFEHFPQFLKFSHRLYLNYFFRRFAQRADRIVTVSEYSKKDISDLYHIPLEKIDVVYNGAHELYAAVDSGVKENIRKEYSGGHPYFIFIGSLNPRKNLANLFIAFDLFRKSHKSATKLLIVGQKQWWNAEIAKAYDAMEFKDEVIFTGRLEPGKLNELLSSALALAYVSLFEGFGIPIVEAFYAETAVITADTTSMPEVAGDAALLVDPSSVTGIANALYTIDTDETLRLSLIEKGKIRRTAFSWDLSAEKLWKAVEKLM